MTQLFTLLGERCSGTNLVESWVKKNASAVLEYPFGFKHFPDLNKLANFRTPIACIVVVRHPEAWVRSFFEKPWHVPNEIKHLCLQDFIRTEWRSVWDEQAGISKDHPLFGTEMKLDRNQVTGRRFENILQMRTFKLRLLREILESRKNATLVQLEELLLNQNKTMVACCNRIGLATVPTPVAIRDYKGKASWRRKLARMTGLEIAFGKPESKRAAGGLSSDDTKWIWSQLDLETEKYFCYFPAM